MKILTQIIFVTIICILSAISVIASEDYTPQYRYTISELLPEEGKLKGIAYDSTHLALLSAAALGGLTLLPMEETNWFEDCRNYSKNVRLGACMDDDHWGYNYIAHPYVGALYYSLARQNGFNRLQAFGYSFFMSTIFWEYGIEAYFQRPSIQDLIITPLVGTALGWTFELGLKYIKNKDGVLFGSKVVGGVATFIMNPLNISINASQNLGQYLEGYGISFNFVLNEPFYTVKELQRFNSYNLERQQLDTWTGIMLEYKIDIVSDFFENLLGDQEKKF